MSRIRARVPEILILFICAVLLLGGIGAKEGYHMDELLSFELANAEFNPWIVPTQPQGRLAKYVERELRRDTLRETLGNLADTVRDVLQNRGGSKLLSYRADVYDEPVRITGQAFEDYITVGERDAFNYLSVYFNVKDDNHPPLHFMALHTVCSLFRGRIAPLMGCVINLLCVLGVMALLMRSGRDMMTLWGCERYGRAAGICAAVLYGLSAGAMSTTLLIRMYAMLTFFCVALFHIHLRKLFGARLGGGDFGSRNKGLIAVTLLGFWTQYFFLFYCLVLAAVTAVILRAQKRGKELWRYIRSMVTAAVIGVAVFPFSISDVFSSGRGVEALENLSSGFAGYGKRLATFGGILLRSMGPGIVIAAAICFIFMILVFVKSYGEKETERSAEESLRSEKAPRVVRDSLIVLLLPVTAYFLLAARMSPYLTDRYVMPVFPFVMLCGAILGCAAVAKWERTWHPDTRAARTVMCIWISAAILCQIANPAVWQNPYMYKGYGEQEKIAEEYADHPCVCVYDGVSYYENLPELARYESTLLLTEAELENRRDRESVTAGGSVVILLKHGTDGERVRNILENEYGMRCEKTLLEQGEPFGDSIFLFRTAR
ncbi:MAG: hypothetical protein NC079_02905 [Clostridium sp.]|nr:hypothetical protein [Clostridium sp.]